MRPMSSKSVSILLACIVGLVFLAAIGVGFGFYRTWKTGRMHEFGAFQSGTLPPAMPEGPWRGSAPELGDVSWKGKKFLEGGKGINVFEKNGVKSEAYEFAFYETAGLDAAHVIRLDYGQPGNPLWLRLIVDEMVSVGENRYLGLVYLKIIPGLPFRMGYFRLEK